MYKFIVAATVATGANALADLGAGGLTSLLLLDQLSNDNYYYGHHGGMSDLLPLLALGGGVGLDSANLNEYLLWDSVNDHSGHRYESLPLMALTGNAAAAQEIFLLDRMSGGRHGSKMLPMAAMSGAISGFSSPMTQLWAMNRYGGGSSEDFNNLASMSTLGLTGGADLNTLWGVQQMQQGHNSMVPLMAATGQPLPTSSLESLWALDHVSPSYHSGHYGYGRRHHGYSRHAPVRSYGTPVHAAPRAAPVHAAPVRAAQQFPRTIVTPATAEVMVEEETVEQP